MADFLSPDQLARLQATQQVPTTPTSWAAGYQPVAPVEFAPPPMPVAEPSLADTFGRKMGDVSALGGALINPTGLMTSTLVGESIGDRVRRGMRPETRDIKSFERDQPQELKPMDTPLTNVQPGRTLADMGSPYKMSAGMGLGGGIGSGPSLGGQIDTAQKGQLSALGRERDAQGREGVGIADRTEQTAAMEEDDAIKAGRMWNDAAGREAEVNAGVDSFFRTNERMTQEVASAKIDSNRLFKNMGAGDKIVMGIGAALGGMLAGLKGGPNQYMAVIDHKVDRDVEDQRSAVENKRAGLQARQNMYGQLLSQTGDRRLADMQLRNLQLESIKAQTKAKADGMKVPEILEKSNQLVAGIELKQAALQTAMLEHKQQQQAAAAAATAAARAHAEQVSFDRQVKLTELGQHADEINIKKAEAGLVPGAANKETRAAVAKLGDQLASPDMVRGRESLDRLVGQIEKTKPGEHIPGFTLTDRTVGGLPLVGGKLRSDQANTNEQDYKALLGVYSNIRTGSGGSDKEADKILAEAEGKNSPAERANFIRKMQADLARRENSYRAAAGPDASAQYDANASAIKGTMPNTVQRKP